MIGVRDEMAMQEEEIREENERVMCRRVKAGREVWTVVAVYVNGNMEQKLEKMRGWMERQSEKGRVNLTIIRIKKQYSEYLILRNS